MPPYARVPAGVLGEIENDLSDEDEIARDRLDSAFARFEATQPAIAERVARALGRPIDETALALGYFLTLAVWLAFERNFEGREVAERDRKSTRLNSSHTVISYAVFCLDKKR